MMDAEFFSVESRSARSGRLWASSSLEHRLRVAHRWTSVVFTLTVAANFMAMIWGQVPALITYSPLLPLLLLLISGLYMLVRHHVRGRQPPLCREPRS